jgi:hypothetical protein
MEAPAPRGPPDCTHSSERRSAPLSEAEAFQILSDAFTSRFDESFSERPVPVEQRRPGSRFRAGSEAGVRLGRKRHSSNGHKIRYFSAPFDVNPDGATRHCDGDAATSVAYAEPQRSLSTITIVIKVGLSV